MKKVTYIKHYSFLRRVLMNLHQNPPLTVDHSKSDLLKRRQNKLIQSYKPKGFETFVFFKNGSSYSISSKFCLLITEKLEIIKFSNPEDVNYSICYQGKRVTEIGINFRIFDENFSFIFGRSSVEQVEVGKRFLKILLIRLDKPCISLSLS
ncbi:MAG: hypothetical protein ACRCXZ_06940 [Patescibacteria group bacterium]